MSLGSISSESLEESDLSWNLIKNLGFLQYDHSLEEIKPSHFRFPDNAEQGDVTKFSEFGLDVIKNFLHIGLVSQDDAGKPWIWCRVLLLVWPSFVSPSAYQNRKMHLPGIKRVKTMLYCVPKAVLHKYSEGSNPSGPIVFATAILTPTNHWKYLERILISYFYQFLWNEPTEISFGNSQVWEHYPIKELAKEWKQLIFLCCGPQEVAYQVKRLVKRNWARIVRKCLSDQEIQADNYNVFSEGNLFELLVWWTRSSVDQNALLTFLKDTNSTKPALSPSQVVENCKIPFARHILTHKKYRCSRCSYGSNNKFLLSVHQNLHVRILPQIRKSSRVPEKKIKCQIPFARHILTYKKYRCSRCKYSSNSKFLFSVHESLHVRILPQIRKSLRITEKEIQSQSTNVLKEAIVSDKNEQFLLIYWDRKKGRGILSDKEFRRNEFVVEYKGDLITHKEGLALDKKYEKHPSVGCYLYFFEHKNKKWCIDATAETVFKGRLLNHSKLRPNLKTKIIVVDNKIRLCLMALRDIKKGEELTFNYGDNCGATIEKNPWLKNS